MKKRRPLFRSKKGLTKKQLFLLSLNSLNFKTMIRRTLRRYRAQLVTNITQNNSLFRRLTERPIKRKSDLDDY